MLHIEIARVCNAQIAEGYAQFKSSISFLSHLRIYKK